MGSVSLPELATRLIEHGRAPSTPVALVSDGTTPRQRRLNTTLGAARAGHFAASDGAPTLVIVGEVAALAMLDHRDAPTALADAAD